MSDAELADRAVGASSGTPLSLGLGQLVADNARLRDEVAEMRKELETIKAGTRGSRTE